MTSDSDEYGLPLPDSCIIVGFGGVCVDLLATVRCFPVPDSKMRSTQLKICAKSAATKENQQHYKRGREHHKGVIPDLDLDIRSRSKTKNMRERKSERSDRRKKETRKREHKRSLGRGRKRRGEREKRGGKEGHHLDGAAAALLLD
ncbi:hypothetical protein PIB30_055912 [Stylosanthes scabra]|uniref:Uncharacterized protein n=1 Tax=Stylosanthes scabra TaxID=79078 RepID=A0ABU6TJ31_9FABA|nr:hypothetical protein [Stylosanthes scabra]